MNTKIKKLKGSDESVLSKHLGGDKIIFIIVFAIFLVHSITLIYPVIWLFLSSLKESTEYFVGNPFALPEEWLFSNYKEALFSLSVGKVTFPVMLLNTIWYVALSTLSGIVAPMTVGYVLSRYDFPGKKLIYGIAIFSMTIPIVGTGGAALKLRADLGLYDNPLMMVLGLLGGFGGSFLVFYGFFKSVSWSYAEAVEIDGGGPFTVYFKIMVPQAMPMIMTYAITGAIAAWNQYENILLYYPSWPTISAGLFTYRSNNARNNYPLYYAGLFISMIPSIALFAIFSGKIMTSLSVGGLKG